MSIFTDAKYYSKEEELEHARNIIDTMRYESNIKSTKIDKLEEEIRNLRIKINQMDVCIYRTIENEIAIKSGLGDKIKNLEYQLEVCNKLNKDLLSRLSSERKGK